MNSIRIFFSYQHVNKPWGGANSFIRSLRRKLELDSMYEFATTIDEEYDVLFMNQLSLGPGLGSKKMKLNDVLQAVHETISSRKKSLVVRAINLNRHAFGYNFRSAFSFWMQDRATIGLLNHADHVVFQSEYQKGFFVAHGYNGHANTVIHNGADDIFAQCGVDRSTIDGQLRLVSVTATNRSTKRHDLIARMSDVKGVDVVHIGAWPADVNPRGVQCLGTLDIEGILNVYKNSHYFLHPAIKDPCPNVLFEALGAGLPVIFNPDVGSSPEIVGDSGIPLDASNLLDTIQRARYHYRDLAERVYQRRDYFMIGRAAKQYGSIFQEVVIGKALSR